MRRRTRRPRPTPPSLTNAWISLGFLVLMLVMLLLMKNQVAASAAGCFARMSEEPEEAQIVVPQAPDITESNVRVVLPDTTSSR